MNHSFLDAAHRDSTLFRIVGSKRINGNKIGTHTPDVIQNQIYHHFVVLTPRCEQVDQHNAVDRTERMIGHGDERSFRKMLQHLCIVYSDGNAEIIKYASDERRAGSIQISMMKIVDIVQLQELHQPPYNFRMLPRNRSHSAQVVVVKHRPLFRFVVSVIFRSLSCHPSFPVQRRTFAIGIFLSCFNRCLFPRNKQFCLISLGLFLHCFLRLY